MRSLSDFTAAFWAELRMAQFQGLAVPAQFDPSLAQAGNHWRYRGPERGGDCLWGFTSLIALHDLLDREDKRTLQRLASLLQPSKERCLTDVEFADYVRSGDAGAVKTDEVISIELEPCYHGSVHNLETLSGHYTAGGIVVHNCRSILLPITLADDISSDANDPVHWATSEELGAAKRMIPGEFGGSFVDTKKNAPIVAGPLASPATKAT
jgi:hypothetical protein